MINIDSISKEPTPPKFIPKTQPKRLFSKVNKLDLLMFTRELKTVLESGLDINSALILMSQQTQKKEMNGIITNIVVKINKGSNLSQSMAEYPWLFDRVYLGSIRAGEYNGDIPKSLENLEHLLEKEIDMRRKVSMALIYPSIAMTVCLAFTYITFKYLLPNLIEFLTSNGGSLPLPTQILIAITQIVSYPWTLPIVLVLCFLAVTMFKSYTNMPYGRYAFHMALLRIPVIGVILKKIAYTNITNSLTTLINNGISLTKAVELAGEASGNAVFEASCKEASKLLNDGVPLSDFLLRNQDLYGKIFASMFAIGEESGSLPDMTEKLNNLYEVDVDNALGAIGVIIEPVLIVITGIIIGFVMLGVFMPLYNTISNMR